MVIMPRRVKGSGCIACSTPPCTQVGGASANVLKLAMVNDAHEGADSCSTQAYWPAGCCRMTYSETRYERHADSRLCRSRLVLGLPPVCSRLLMTIDDVHRHVMVHEHRYSCKNSACLPAFCSKTGPVYASKCPRPRSICSCFGSRARENASIAMSAGVK